MSATVTTRMTEDGGMVVRVKGTTDRAAARKLAQEAAGTAFVSAAQEKRNGFVIPVTAKALAARKVVAAVPPAKAVKAAKAAPAKAERELPAFLRKAPVTCETCRDHGVVRKLGKHAGQPYKTADGAAAATANGNAVKCPSHRKARRAA